MSTIQYIDSILPLQWQAVILFGIMLGYILDLREQIKAVEHGRLEKTQNA
jgi:hypothetical protein